MVLKIGRLQSFLAALFCLAVSLAVCIGNGVISVEAKQEEIALPVVMYHQITKENSRAGRYVITYEQLEKDLIFLKEKGYATVTVSDLVRFTEKGVPLPEKPVMITFDDGCVTVLQYAQPLFEKHNMRAVAFVVGSFTDYYSGIDDNNPAYASLVWDDVKTLSDGGVIEIQSHSYSLHCNTDGRNGAAKKCGETLAAYENVIESDALKMRDALVSVTGKAPVGFAYPFGSYSKESAQVFKDLGFKALFLCEERVNKINKADTEWMFSIGRYNRPHGISSESFFEKMGI